MKTLQFPRHHGLTGSVNLRSPVNGITCHVPCAQHAGRIDLFGSNRKAHSRPQRSQRTHAQRDGGAAFRAWRGDYTFRSRTLGTRPHKDSSRCCTIDSSIARRGHSQDHAKRNLIVRFRQLVGQILQSLLQGDWTFSTKGSVTTDPENNRNSPLAAPFRGDTRIRLQRVFSCFHGDRSTLLMRKRNAHSESCHLSNFASARRSLIVRVRVRAPPAALRSLMV